MQIILNGTPTELEDGCTIAAVVSRLELAGKRMAVEVNEEIVPRSQHASFTFEVGDQVEIVHAVGGG